MVMLRASHVASLDIWYGQNRLSAKAVNHQQAATRTVSHAMTCGATCSLSLKICGNYRERQHIFTCVMSPSTCVQHAHSMLSALSGAHYILGMRTVAITAAAVSQYACVSRGAAR